MKLHAKASSYGIHQRSAVGFVSGFADTFEIGGFVAMAVLIDTAITHSLEHGGSRCSSRRRGSSCRGRCFTHTKQCVFEVTSKWT